MCGIFDDHNYSFKWIIYLVVVTGICTFIHWFLITPLTYSHIYEHYNERWPKSWVAWFLAASFISWCIVTVLIVFVWLCARNRCGDRIDKSNSIETVFKKERTDTRPEGRSATISPYWESDCEYSVANSVKEKSKMEILVLPEMSDLKDSLTVVNLNEKKGCSESNSFDINFTIPVDETRCFVQMEVPEQKLEEERSHKEKPLKSPREIFFQDLISDASKMTDSNKVNSDPDKHLIDAADVKTKFNFEFEKIIQREEEAKADQKMVIEESEKTNNKCQLETKNTYFIGSFDTAVNVTSEIFMNLGDKKEVVEAEFSHT